MVREVDTVDYWLQQIEQHGLEATERKLPNVFGNKLTVAMQAIREHERAEKQRDDERRDAHDKETRKLAAEANGLSRQGNKIAWGALAVAVVSIVLAGVALWLERS